MHRASHRPRYPSLPQRFTIGIGLLLAAVSVLVVRDLAGLRVAMGDAAPGALRHSRRVVSPLWHRSMTHYAAQSMRDFFRQRASILSPDQAAVVEMTRHAWSAYRQWGNWSDALNLVNKTGSTEFDHDMAYAVLDALDTLFIMGLHEEFDAASEWVTASLRQRMFQAGYVSFFETCVRSLGGLLSAFYLSGETPFLELATELGESLQQSFTCGITTPCRYVDLVNHTGGGYPTLAEANSFQLEFSALAQFTKKESYRNHVDSMNEIMESMISRYYDDGLVPEHIDWDAQRGFSANMSFGCLSDTYYEYLLKQWIRSGKTDDKLKALYLQAIDGMAARLLIRSESSNLSFVGGLDTNGRLIRRMDHLSCFLPGTLALGAFHGLPSGHFELAEALMNTCIQMYRASKLGLAPEAIHFLPTNQSHSKDVEIVVQPADDFNILRPEVIESLFVLHRVTGNDIYRAYGREIMQAFERHSKVQDGGYQGTQHVFHGPAARHGAKMEGFVVGETFKYLYLLFSDAEMLPLDQVVFNTKAHPFPIAVAAG
ncbi:hypothetical protein ATCC90586_000861 [Pythium insidiosum]|nr:hypothetical protein ATCC90586_000861 [Pythium insidiosum]